MNLAIVGTYPSTSLHYPLILISKGPLPSAENAPAVINIDNNILFSWADNTGTGTAKANDKVILIAYFPVLKQIIYSLQSATRADCQAVLETNKMHGYTAETWVGFLSCDENDAANSVYAGSVVIST